MGFFRHWWDKLRRKSPSGPVELCNGPAQRPSQFTRPVQTAQPAQSVQAVNPSEHGPSRLQRDQGRNLADAIQDLNVVLKEHGTGASSDSAALEPASPLNQLSFQGLVQSLQTRQEDREAAISSKVGGFFSKLAPVARLALNATSGVATATSMAPGVGVAVGGLTVVLELALAPGASTETIMTTLDSVQEDSEFARSLADPDLSIAAPLQSCVEDFTINLVDFLRVSIGFLQGYISKFFKLTLGLVDVDKAVSDLLRSRDKLDMDVNRLVLSLVLRKEQRLVDEHDVNPLGSLAYLDWHKTARGIRIPGTGAWFEKEWRLWLEDNKRPSLLCHGIAGSGKTCLASLAIDCIDTESLGSNVGLAYVYCHYTRYAEQSKGTVFGSIARQLIAMKPSMARKYYWGNATTEWFKWDERLPQMIAEFSRVYLVLDGLDEFSENADHELALVETLATVRDSKNVGSSKLRLAIFARSGHSFEEKLKSHDPMLIAARSDDIAKYLNTKISADKLARFVEWQNKDATFFSNILSAVSKSSDGSFELPARRIDDVLRNFTKNDALEAARSTYTQINDYYRKEINRIKAQGPEEHSYALKLITWLAYASRPCHQHELSAALGFKRVAKAGLDVDNMAIEDMPPLINSCEGLIMTVNRAEPSKADYHLLTAQQISQLLSGPEVTLSHRMVWEFLVSERNQLLPNGKSFIFSRCLSCLCSPALAPLVRSMYDGIHKITFHRRLLARASVEGDVGSKANAFLIWAFDSWGHYCPEVLGKTEYALLAGFHETDASRRMYRFSALHLCGLMGFDRAAQVLRRSGFSVTAKDGDEDLPSSRTPYQVAVDMGNRLTAEALDPDKNCVPPGPLGPDKSSVSSGEVVIIL